MNAAQIHLALNHVPLFMAILGALVLILGMIRKNQSFINLSFYLLAAAAVFTIPVFLTGEGTEEMVEKLAGVNENAIEEHEDMAKTGLIIILITGGLALIGIFFKRNATMAKVAVIGSLLLSVASFGAMARTAHLGGLIRHSELQNAGTAATGQEGTDTNESENKAAEEKDDDD
ncbi:MAG TPA: DUF2231 domain-containing protein [Chitinophagaceae bacterium]|nr:DUF2231 domain-containing protein [Chitinophagaceae bacterium]